MLVGAIIVKSVNTQRAFDRYGLVFVSLTEKHHASAKSADDGFSGLVQRGIGPDSQDAVGGLGLGVRFKDRQRLVHVPLGTAGRSKQCCQTQPEDAATVSSCVRAISRHRGCLKVNMLNWTAVVLQLAVPQGSAARRSVATDPADPPARVAGRNRRAAGHRD